MRAVNQRIFKLLAAERLVIVRWFGPVTFEGVVEWLDELIAHPLFSADFDGIVDLREADLTDMSPMQVKAVAQLMVERQLTRGRWVHLVAGPMETALSMVFSVAVREQYQAQVVSTVEAAAEYLGRDPAALYLTAP